MKNIESYCKSGIHFFEKYSAEKKKMPFSANREDGVRVIGDSNTGLYWEVKSAHKEDVNYCGDTYHFQDAKSIYIDKMNAANYGGYNDWRLPNKDELRSIFDYGLQESVINRTIFENCPIGDYWTKDRYEMQPYFGWVLYSGFGSGIAKSMNTGRYVLAVRGGRDRRFGESDSSRFTDNKDGTITDAATGLMWQKGENERCNLYEAEKKCKEMNLGGYTDWRLPNIKELNTILNLEFKDSWWYFKDFFPAEGLAPPLLHYFSSSLFQDYYVWVTNFCFGYDGYYGGKMAPLLFRAVRETEIVEETVKTIITHTGENKVYDVEGCLTTNERYQGLDATRVTSPLSYERDAVTKIVKDQNTGLFWDTSHEEELFTWEEAKKFVETLNQVVYQGYSDWRLPNREELRSLALYDGSIPAITEEFFPDTKAEFYWSGQEHKGDPVLAWGVYFGYGCCIGYPKKTKAYVRAVRSGGLSFHDKDFRKCFRVNADRTVTDLCTGLMWMQEETPLLTLTEALQYCKELRLGGYDDWCLPNIKELGTLINLEDGDTWFYPELFPNTNIAPQGFYMASTTYDATFGWGCNFQFGFDGYYADRKNGKYPFRPVRRG